MGTAPACAREALDMVRAGLGYLAAADATRLAAATQAECLRELEQAGAVATAARAAVLAAFTAGQGYAGDAEYSAVSWLIHRTGITRGAAVGHAAWAGRTRTHPRVVAALAAGQVSGVGRAADLPVDRASCRRSSGSESDEVLLAAAAGGLGLEELASLVAEMYERARGDLPDEDPGRDFADRALKLATTFGGAGVIHGDLTPECAEVVGRVLDALAAPAGKDDDRTKDQRYHDALAEAMRRLVASGLLPERAGQPVKAWVHISLADLLLLDGDSALQEQWTAQVRAAVGRAPGVRVRDRQRGRRLARRGRRRGGRVRRGDGPAGHRRRQRRRPGGPGPAVRGTGPAPPRWRGRRPAGRTPRPGCRTPRRRGRRWSRRSSARRWTCCPGRAGWRRSCAAGSWARGWAGRACRWTSGTPSRSRPGSATR